MNKLTLLTTALSLSFLVLNMTGHERFTALLSWSTTMLNVILNAVLIPRWGVEGAALATSFSLVMAAFISLIAVRKKLGIDTSLIGLSFNGP